MRSAWRFSTLILLIVPWLMLTPDAAAAPGDIRLVSVATDGTRSDYDSGGSYGGPSAISADGRFVAFASFATTLVPGDTNDNFDIFVRDLERNVTERVSIASDGSQAAGMSTFLAISADGRFIAFVSDAPNLVPGDDGRVDVFVRDRQSGQTERIHITGVAPDGSIVHADARSPSLSADGRYVALGANLSYQQPDSFHYFPGVYVHDRVTGTNELVSVASNGSPISNMSLTGNISADGRFVTFVSTAADVTPDDTDDWWDFFVRDRVLGTTVRVPNLKYPPYAGFGTIEISGNGRFVAIWHPGYSDPPEQIPGGVWVYDLQTHALTQLEHLTDSATGTTGVQPSMPSFSADGQYLAVSASIQDTNDQTGFFVLDPQTGSAQLVTVGLDPGRANVSQPDVSADGGSLIFEGYGEELLAGYEPAWPHTDIFVVDTAGTLPPLPIANDAFRRTWARTDQPVSELQVGRTWMWGPTPFTEAIHEPYAEAQGGTRLVQYFDKARMELTYPGLGSDSAWQVTNGLLVIELMTGQMQLGDATFVQYEPSQSNIAGDPDDPLAPTYASFAALLDAPPLADDAPIIGEVRRDGSVREDGYWARFGVRAGPLVPETNHRVASVFWDFLHSSGLVELEAGWTATDRLFDPWYYASGLPITEPYWASIAVNGSVQDVLIQAFERRVLTYTPSNPPGWQVEAGNVGRHYLQWRYGTVDQAQGMIAYTSWQDDPGNLASAIHVVNGDGTGHRNLSSATTGSDSFPSWSPGGLWLAFVSDRDGDPEIYTMDADGTGFARLTDRPGADLRPIWSPNGSQLTFQSWVEPDHARLAVIDGDGMHLQILTEGSAHDASWDPYGTRLVFTHANQIFLADTRTGAIQQVTTSSSAKGWPGWDWGPDGERITFWSDGYISTVRLDGSGETRLWEEPMLYGSLAWSPDGQQVAFIRADATSADIYVMQADGTGLTRITTGCTCADAIPAVPSWSPDGQYLAYHTGSWGNGEIRVANVAHPEWEHRVVGHGLYPHWSPAR